MPPKINISGEKELLKTLKMLTPKEQKAAVRKASRATAKLVNDDAKGLVPVDTGVLEQSLTVRTATKIGRNRIGHRVVTRENHFEGDAFYGHFVEFGTVHREADPFLRPALFGNETEMKRNFTRELQKSIKAIARKAPKPKKG